jgi:branched-chain amino acid transport system substrate-binding protein
VAACGSSSKSQSSGATTTASTVASSSTSGAATTVAATSAAATGAKVSTGGGGKDGTIQIGYVSPVTGALAGFGEADAFSLKQMNDLFKDGLMIQGKSYKVEIHQEDSQSDANKAGELASKLILDDSVDLILVGGTPETTNPVCDQAEANGVPALATACPWQPWFFRQANADPAKGYTWTFDMFWGLEDVEANYLDIWGSTTTNKVCAGLFPNDGDGNAWGDAQKGFPSVVGPKGYKTVDPGRYQDGTDDFSAQIAQFKQANCEILYGVPIPPDFATFWKQAQQQGFKPKLATIAKAILFPSAVEAIGDSAIGLATEVWWSPNHPFASSLTGQTCKQLGDLYTSTTAKQWTQPVGFSHALFEVAVTAFTQAGGTDKAKVRDAIQSMSTNTIVGPVAWGKDTSVPKNIAKTPLAAGQWQKGTGQFKYDLVTVVNAAAPQIPTNGTLQPLQ